MHAEAKNKQEIKHSFIQSENIYITIENKALIIMCIFLSCDIETVTLDRIKMSKKLSTALSNLKRI